MLSVFYAECHIQALNAVCHIKALNAECHYTECRYVECHGTLLKQSSPIFIILLFKNSFKSLISNNIIYIIGPFCT
jgi:hypothetical protein